MGRFSVGEKPAAERMRPREPGGKGSEGTYHAGSEQKAGAERIRPPAFGETPAPLRFSRPGHSATNFRDGQVHAPKPKLGDEGFG